MSEQLDEAEVTAAAIADERAKVVRYLRAELGSYTVAKPVIQAIAAGKHVVPHRADAQTSTAIELQAGMVRPSKDAAARCEVRL